MRTSPGRIKDRKRWIAAGDGFRRAARLLSDGAFKLFIHIALEADSRTGCMEGTYKTLAADLRKSKRSIGIYASELHNKGVCKVKPGENQYCKTRFEIRNDYWPYERGVDVKAGESDGYVTAIQSAYLELDCTTDTFSSTDAQTAREFEKEGMPLETVKNALLLGAVRKYSSCLNGKDSALIGSLIYFKNLVTEIQKQSLPVGYREYLSRKNNSLARICKEKGLIDSGSIPATGSKKRK